MTINGVKASAFGGTFSWVGRKMTFDPTSNLLPGTSYKIVIGRMARSRAGLNMTKPFTWTFTTKPAVSAALTVASAPTASGAQVTLNLASAADVSVSIRNLAGREIALLQPGQMAAGVQSLVWNGKSAAGTKVPAGTYLLEATAHCSDGTSAKAMTSLVVR
jgi:flagellar hook assembly protein FlgD